MGNTPNLNVPDGLGSQPVLDLLKQACGRASDRLVDITERIKRSAGDDNIGDTYAEQALNATANMGKLTTDLNKVFTETHTNLGNTGKIMITADDSASGMAKDMINGLGE
jgi:hypothetical protein